MTKTVKPIYEGFLCNRDQDILARLDQAAKKLKEKRDAQIQDNHEDDNAVPATPNLEKSHSLGDEPVGHHVLRAPRRPCRTPLRRSFTAPQLNP